MTLSNDIATQENDSSDEALLAKFLLDSAGKDLTQAFTILKNAGLFLQGNMELYAVLINNDRHANQLALGFTALNKAGFPYQNNVVIYRALINKVYYADRLEQDFAILQNANVPYQGNTKICLSLINNFGGAKNIAQGFTTLQQTGLPYQDNAELYDALINSNYYAQMLALGFTTLNKAGFSYKNNIKLYKGLIKAAHYADKLEQGFAILQKANVPYHDNNELCLVLINNLGNIDKLEQGFAILQKANVPYQGNIEIFLALINNANYADKLEQGFITLQKANVPYQGNIDICLALIKNACYTYQLTSGFTALQKANVSYQGNIDICLAFINNLCNTDKLEQGFSTLQKANVPYQGNTEICVGLIKNAYYAKKLAPAFTTLSNANIFYRDNGTLYQQIINHPEDANKLAETVEVLNHAGIYYQAHPHLFNSHLLLANDNLTIYVIKKLTEVGYSFKIHQNLFTALCTELSAVSARYQVVLNIVNHVIDYAKANSLLMPDNPDFAQQLQELDTIIDSNCSACISLTEGPLNKAKATLKIEQLLEKIAQADIANHILITFNKCEHYILTLPGEKEINLSLLIKYANLSQLTLSEPLISKLGDVLKMLVVESWRKQPADNPIVKLLPQTQQIAAQHYLNNIHYININKLFRSEPLESTYNFNPQADKNRLACFLIGCLLNDAANKINFLPQELRATDEAQSLDDLLPKTVMLDRREILNEETIKGRIANIWTFPSLTSFSVNKEGSMCIREPNKVQTKLENTAMRYVINDVQGEVLFAQGEQVMTTQGPGFLLSKIVRSPQLVPQNHYWSDIALIEASDYLRKQYLDGPSAITINGKEIVRPNHDPSHIYRVMECIEYTIDYYAQYAGDEDFRKFCQSLTPAEAEWLRTAAAFSVTGRESEVKAIENLKLYDKYREASAEHFEQFVNKTPYEDYEESEHLAMKQRIKHVVRYMGNPDYESKFNLELTPKERQTRNFYHRLLNIAHKIDLPRCYTAAEFYQSIQFCRNLSAVSPAQKSALDEIIRYNIELIKAHGVSLRCDIQPNGELVDANRDYQDIFAQASSSMKRLGEITQTVTRPQKRLAETNPRINNNKKRKQSDNTDKDQNGRIITHQFQRHCSLTSQRETNEVFEEASHFIGTAFCRIL